MRITIFEFFIFCGPTVPYFIEFLSNKIARGNTAKADCNFGFHKPIVGSNLIRQVMRLLRKMLNVKSPPNLVT